MCSGSDTDIYRTVELFHSRHQSLAFISQEEINDHQSIVTPNPVETQLLGTVKKNDSS
jgi:hypothetical protein